MILNLSCAVIVSFFIYPIDVVFSFESVLIGVTHMAVFMPIPSLFECGKLVLCFIQAVVLVIWFRATPPSLSDFPNTPHTFFLPDSLHGSGRFLSVSANVNPVTLQVYDLMRTC